MITEVKTHQLLDEVVRLLTILVKKDELQSSVVQEMHAAGIAPKRIAELLGITPNAARVAAHQAKKKKTKFLST